MNTDYRVYIMNRKERACYYAAAALLAVFLGVLFYRSILFSLALSLLAIPGEKLWQCRLKGKRQEKMLREFRDVLCSLSSALASGLQLPDALEDACSNVCFESENSDLKRELMSICRSYRSSHAVMAQLLEDLGRRSGLEDIASFAVSCSVCMDCGGDLEAVSLHTAALLLDRMDFARELHAMTAQKKTDIAILTSMPMLVLLFLNLTSSGYIQPLYETLTGRVVMTLALVLIGTALLWSMRMIGIEI